MKKNIGKADSWMRIVAGLILLGLAFTGVLTPWGYIGIIPLVTGLISFCPLYTLIGINTCTK